MAELSLYNTWRTEAQWPRRDDQTPITDLQDYMDTHKATGSFEISKQWEESDTSKHSSHTSKLFSWRWQHAGGLVGGSWAAG